MPNQIYVIINNNKISIILIEAQEKKEPLLLSRKTLFNVFVYKKYENKFNKSIKRNSTM